MSARIENFIRELFLTKSETHESVSATRIDGCGRCYPNCASDVWLRSCEHEILNPIEGKVKGEIPNWINGSLLRNGPGSWKVGQDMTFQHLFDCSALLHRFAIRNGRVTYQNRFVETETLKKNRAAQRIVVTEFGTAAVPDPCQSIFDKVSAIFRPDSGSDNSMISIYPFGDEFYAFTETPFIHRINPQTLATESRVCLTDYVGIVNHTSHPHVMTNGTVYNLGMSATRFGPAYNIVCFPNDADGNMFDKAKTIGTIPCRWKLHPGYMHTFGVTKNYFVIVEQPLSISVSEYIKAHLYNQNFSASLKWFENKTTIFHLMDRKTGKVTHTFQSDPFFYLHIINSYEENDHVVIDICCYKDPEMINCMFLESIVNMQSNPNYASLFRGRPLRFVLPLLSTENKRTNIETFSNGGRRFVRSITLGSFNSHQEQLRMKQSQSHQERIAQIITNTTGRSDERRDDDVMAKNETKYEPLMNLVSLNNTQTEAYLMADKTIFVRPELLYDWGCETPRINYEIYSGTKYRYFYAISSDVDVDNPGTLIKVDVLTKTAKKWCEANCYPSEPIFVPKPESKDEDDGVILASMVWAGLDDNHVGLLVLCAKSLTELGRSEFRTNGPVPKCLHGWFAPQTEK